MTRRNERSDVNRSILNCDFFGFTPPSTPNVNNCQEAIPNFFSRGESVLSLKHSYLELDFEVTQSHIDGLEAGILIRLINFAAIALISEYELTTSSGRHLENSEHALKFV